LGQESTNQNLGLIRTNRSVNPCLRAERHVSGRKESEGTVMEEEP